MRVWLRNRRKKRAHLYQFGSATTMSRLCSSAVVAKDDKRWKDDEDAPRCKVCQYIESQEVANRLRRPTLRWSMEPIDMEELQKWNSSL